MVRAISNEEFDRLFDDGEVDILEYLDLDNPIYPRQETVAVTLLSPTYERLERESNAAGLPVRDHIEQILNEHAMSDAA